MKSRSKGKYNVDYTLIDTYPLYVSNVEEKLQVDKKTYLKINKEFLLKIRENILTKSESFQLPCRLGLHRIRKNRQKIINKSSLKVDWKLSKKHHKKIYHLNEHRNGYYYRWFWMKEGPVINKSYYSFIPCRENARLLSAILQKYKMGQLDYNE